MKRYTVTQQYASGSGTHERTDHSAEITLMRHEVKLRCERIDPLTATKDEALQIAAIQCAAALLECHDATGISLDDWVGPRELVEQVLMLLGLGDEFLKNGV